MRRIPDFKTSSSRVLGMRYSGLALVVPLLTFGPPLVAEPGVLIFKPLVTVKAGAAGATGAASLFAGDRNGLFRPVSPPPPKGGLTGGTDIARLLDLIARAEAGRKGYDAVQYGATIKPPGNPSTLTIAEILEWIAVTPGQPHAIGRYQFIPSTLRRLVRAEGVSTTTRFSPQVQDQLASRLLQEAGLDAFRRGTLSRGAFMDNLAKIWAGLPTASGRSHYHGYAGNKATMRRDFFDQEIRAIFGDG